jgi:hypothetical protein
MNSSRSSDPGSGGVKGNNDQDRNRDSHGNKHNQEVTMKRFLSLFLVGAALAWGTSSQAGVMVLELEKSTDMKTWQKVPVGQEALSPGGGILQNGADASAFYRLRLRDDQNDGFVAVMPLQDAPRQALDVAQQFLRDSLVEDQDSMGGDPEGTWQDAILGPICYPVFDMAVGKGLKPAYLEFKVIKKPIPVPDPGPLRSFPLSAPVETDASCDYGYILVALTKGDSPVAEFSDSGPTPVEALLRKTQASGPIKPIRFDDGFLAAENLKGELVGSIGTEPFQIDPKVLSVAGQEFEGSADFEKGEVGDSPRFEATGYKSYQEMKDDFITNPLFQELRAQRAELAKQEWDLVEGIEPASIQVPLKTRQLILADQKIADASLEDASLAALNVDPSGSGLWVTGQQEGGTLLTVNLADGTQERFILLVGQAAGTGVNLQLATSGWTSWSYWYAGSWSDQRRYNQFYKDSQMCSGGWSGCGPTAWSMLYGWWDRKGSPRLLKNLGLADAPLYNDWSVRDCDRYVFSQVGPFCVNGQAATMPWAMKNGYKWGSARGAGYYISWNWGVPYLSSGCRAKARDSIKAGRPSIIGLGFYWHYPLAYGYAERKYKFLGITLSTSQYFKCNMGWGGSSPQWKNGSSVWFATNGHYW